MLKLVDLCTPKASMSVVFIWFLWLSVFWLWPVGCSYSSQNSPSDGKKSSIPKGGVALHSLLKADDLNDNSQVGVNKGEGDRRTGNENSVALVKQDSFLPQSVVLTQTELSWFDLANAVSDKVTIEQYFQKKRYTPPIGAHLLIAKVLKGAGQPAFEYYAFRDTAFKSSAVAGFWPASTVKLLAAVGALCTLNQHGLTSDAVVEFTDSRKYRGRVDTLIAGALIQSNNLSYDRLIRIAGVDELNGQLLSPSNGFPNTVLQCSYYPKNDSSLRISPEILYKQRKKIGLIAARNGTQQFSECVGETNCTSIFELSEGLRRVMLHHEIPPKDRFDIPASEIKKLKKYLLETPNKIQPAISSVLHPEAKIYNKSGRVPGSDFLEHAFIVTPSGGKFLVAVSVPDNYDKVATSEILLRFTKMAFRAILPRPFQGTVLQRTGGVEIDVDVQLEDVKSGRYKVAAKAKISGKEKFSLWRNNRIVSTGRDGRIEQVLEPLETQTDKSHPELLVFQVTKGRRLVGYKTVSLQIQ